VCKPKLRTPVRQKGRDFTSCLIFGARRTARLCAVVFTLGPGRGSCKSSDALMGSKLRFISGLQEWSLCVREEIH
jgi:hypothetical protein